YGPQHGSGFNSTRTYAEVLQDWNSWMREGILDTNILMNYKRQLTAGQDVMYQEWSDFAKDNQFNRQSVIGTGMYLNDLASSVTQARIAVAPSSAGNSGAGWAGYSYRTPDTQTDAGTRSAFASRSLLAQGLTLPSTLDAQTPAVFSQPAAVPPMTWKTQPTAGHIRGTTAPGAPVSLINASGAIVRSMTADGKGWFAFVDVAPGAYRVNAGSTVLGAAQVVPGGLAAIAPVASPTPTPSPTTPPPPPPPTTCTSSVGPGIPHPVSVPSGIPGFHAQWYGQSGYMTLCAGDTAGAIVAFYNSGSRGWLLGKMGEVAYLGTWGPEPGQDQATPFGGDGTMGSPDTGWPRYNRIAVQPAQWVGPGQVSWFQFNVKAPATPGTYKLYLRPVIENATWMEDFGVYWLITVK
ncbi:MAG: hypothetical protein M3R54_09305, partial [Chloroflexota bacterium]|nr:hypothetical protein [Chloroflexota bacterium]